MSLLFRAPNWLGDAVISRILLLNLKEIYPEITVICKKNLENIFYDFETITFENKKDLFTKSLKLRKNRYDIGIVIPLSLSSAFYLYLAKVKRRIGFSFEMRDIFLTDRIKIPSDWKNRHTIETQFILLDVLNTPRRIPDIYFFPECSETYSIKAQYAAIAPFAAFGDAKEWFFDRYLQLSEMLYSAFNLSTVILGASRDQNKLPNSKLPEFVISMIGKTSLMEAACIIKKAKLFVGNDSGLTHLSAAMGQKTISIFGPMNPVWTSPIGKYAFHIWNPPKCAPCYKRHCPIGTKKCMDNVRVKDVFKITTSVLNNNNK